MTCVLPMNTSSSSSVPLKHDNHQLDVSPGGAEYSGKLSSSNDPNKTSFYVKPSVDIDGNVGIKAGIRIPLGKRYSTLYFITCTLYFELYRKTFSLNFIML